MPGRDCPCGWNQERAVTDNQRSAVLYIGPLAGLTLLFAILKLTGVCAAWSWWAVFAPLWLPVVVFACVIAIMVVIGGLS